MVNRILLALLLLATATAAFPADDQAYLAILAETRLHRIAGMPQMPEMPEMPAGMPNMPGLAMLGGAPERVLEVRLWSPGIAPANAGAQLAPPAGLKQGKRLDLDIYRPAAEKVEGGGGEPDPGAVEDFTIKIYWGSSESVRPGQPKIIRWDGLTPGQKAIMKRQAQQARERSSYFYQPDWTTAYWPTKKQPGKIAKGASLAGGYTLTTNYTGGVSIEAPENVDFLAPIELTSPNLEEPVPLAPPVHLAWQRIPEALGLYASIFGMEGSKTLILWSSSESDSEAIMSSWDYLEMARVRELVNANVMMKGDRISATVPAGIFRNCEMAMLSMIGYGPGAALAQGQPLPRIQTKTTLSVMLGGKSVPDMGEMGDMGGMGDQDE